MLTNTDARHLSRIPISELTVDIARQEWIQAKKLVPKDFKLTHLNYFQWRTIILASFKTSGTLAPPTSSPVASAPHHLPVGGTWVNPVQPLR